MSKKISDFFCMCCGVSLDYQPLQERSRTKRSHKKPKFQEALAIKERQDDCIDINQLAKEIAYPKKKKTSCKQKSISIIRDVNPRTLPLPVRNRIPLSEALRNAIIRDCLRQMTEKRMKH